MMAGGLWGCVEEVRNNREFKEFKEFKEFSVSDNAFNAQTFLPP